MSVYGNEFQVVYERDERHFIDANPVAYERVGVRIFDRVIWLGSTDFRHVPGSSDPSEYEGAKQLAQNIVDGLKLLEVTL